MHRTFQSAIQTSLLPDVKVQPELLLDGAPHASVVSIAEDIGMAEVVELVLNQSDPVQIWISWLSASFQVKFLTLVVFLIDLRVDSLPMTWHGLGACGNATFRANFEVWYS